MNKDDLILFNQKLDKTFEILGDFNVHSTKSQELSRKNARRSLVAKKSISKGKTIEKDDLTFKRPAFGISPRYISEVIGKKAKITIDEDDILQWSFIE